jgi:hypothetical protein
MALYLVGENIAKTRSHYLSATGKLTQLMRGVYVDTTGDIDATILKHAVRIAKYLYPNAYLAAASAILLAPTSDGRLFLSGRRRQRTRLRALEIIQTDAPAHPSVASAIVERLSARLAIREFLPGSMLAPAEVRSRKALSATLHRFTNIRTRHACPACKSRHRCTLIGMELCRQA